MNNMNEMGKYMNSTLEQMDKMMGNQSMLKDKKIHKQFNSMMTNMNSLMNNYKDMMNHIHNQSKGK